MLRTAALGFARKPCHKAWATVSFVYFLRTEGTGRSFEISKNLRPSHHRTSRNVLATLKGRENCDHDLLTPVTATEKADKVCVLF